MGDSDRELRRYLFDIQGSLVQPDVLKPAEVAELNRLLRQQGKAVPGGAIFQRQMGARGDVGRRRAHVAEVILSYLKARG